MRMQGVIKFVHARYFFILIPDRRQIFGHISTWLSEPNPCIGDIVEFDLVASKRKLYEDQAANVVRIKKAEPVSPANILAGAEVPAEVKAPATGKELR